MSDRSVKIPGPDHPITIARSSDRIVVFAGNVHVPDTGYALVLKEASYPPVYYISRSDVDMSLLVQTEHYTYCPYNGARRWN